MTHPPTFGQMALSAGLLYMLLRRQRRQAAASHRYTA